MVEISTIPISTNEEERRGEERRGETAPSERVIYRAVNGQEDNFVSGQTVLYRERETE